MFETMIEVLKRFTRNLYQIGYVIVSMIMLASIIFGAVALIWAWVWFACDTWGPWYASLITISVIIVIGALGCALVETRGSRG